MQAGFTATDRTPPASRDSASLAPIPGIIPGISEGNAIYMTRKFILALAACGIVMAASACNTVKGVGRDIQSVGQAGSDAIH